MSLLTILFILLVHFIADFVFQDEKWAINKSSNNIELLKHTAVYSLIWFIAILLWTQSIGFAIFFCITTWLVHTTTDWVTSRIVADMFKRKEYGSPIPNFGAFTIIGIDQLLHYVQLFLTYWIVL